MTGPTQRQQEILDFLVEFNRREGFWPSVRDIQMEFGFRSTNAVARHLDALVRKGLLEKSDGRARSFRLPHLRLSEPDAPNLLDIPVYGTIAAGYPDGVEPGDALGRIQIDAGALGLRPTSRVFALRVRGDSMIDAGIQEGDTVILENRRPRHRDIVAALIDGETTLKRFIQEGGKQPYLKAENPVYPEMRPARELIIQGVAQAMVRRFR